MEIESSKSEVLEEFEIDGKEAQILRLEMSDFNERDFQEHASNLAETNFVLDESIPNAKKRVVVREGMAKTRQRLANIPVVGQALSGGDLWERVLNKVYPDYSKAEHVNAYANISFPRLINNRQLLAVKLDGRVVAVQGFKKVTETSTGRPVYEFTKASTLNEYKGKKLNPRLKAVIFKEVEEKDPEAIWTTMSVNKVHLDKLEKAGWHVVEVNDQNEAIRATYELNPRLNENMMRVGYKAAYLDPKVDKISDET